VFLEGHDKDLALLGVQAYNDFILDEWCPTAPDRDISLVGLPLWDEDLCIAEIERTAAKGTSSGCRRSSVTAGTASAPPWRTPGCLWRCASAAAGPPRRRRPVRRSPR
jgi:hypothetical protein